MTIDEKLKIVESRMCTTPIMSNYQKELLIKWLHMTDKERDEQIIKSVRNFYACRRPVSIRDYWPVSLTNSYYGTTVITNSNANAEAIKINQRRRAKGLRWSVEVGGNK